MTDARSSSRTVAAEHSATVATSGNDALSRYDLRLRSLDLEPGEGIYLCSRCDGIAFWSVWLHTPEWMPNGGMTYVRCTRHALDAVVDILPAGW